jgi:hypothetical protein
MSGTGARGGRTTEIEDWMKSSKKRRPGRPSRAVASARALADVDLTQVDPRAVLLGIAADTSSPATARVAACKALLVVPENGKSASEEDPITALALKLLKGKP